VKKSRFTEAQIVAILKELDAGTAATELARRHGIHANTIRQWRDKYAGLESSDLTRLKQLEAESARKDRVIARLTMEVDAVRELIAKTAGALAAKTALISARSLVSCAHAA
jgi:putative transposase